jgi:Sec-independent protein translocase protein TatA
MEIFGIGPLELLLIVLIALIVLGPKEMMKSAQKAAAWLKKLRQSEMWSSTKEVMDIPNQVLRESGLDKEIHELQNLSKKGIPDSVWQPTPIPTTTEEPISKEPIEENHIKPDRDGKTKADDNLTEQPPQDEQ